MNYTYFQTEAKNSEGNTIDIELIVQPEYKEYRDDVGKMVTYPEISAIRVIIDGQIAFQIKEVAAHNLCVDLVNMIEKSGVGQRPF